MLLLFSCTIFATACSEGGGSTPETVECKKHIDVDEDNRCDVCDSKINTKKPGSDKSDPFKVTHHVTIEIADYGTVHLDLYGKEAPITVANFVKIFVRFYQILVRPPFFKGIVH